MPSLAVALTEDLLHFVEEQASARNLAPSDYVAALLADARRAADQAALEARFQTALQALARGEPNPLTADDWRRLKEARLPATGPPHAAHRLAMDERPA